MSRPGSGGASTGGASTDGAWILAAVLGVIALAGGGWAAEALAARFDQTPAPEPRRYSVRKKRARPSASSRAGWNFDTV